MAIIRHEIPLSASSYTRIDPSVFSGSCTWYLESCVTSWIPGSVTLKDSSGNAVGTLALSPGLTAEVVRAELDSGEPTADYYYYEATSFITVYGVRVICLQDTGENPLTASESRVLLCHNLYGVWTSYTNDWPVYWKYNASEWDGSITAYLTAFLTAESGATTTLALQKSTNLSSWTDVATITSTSGSLDYQTSSGITLEDGYYYRAAVKTSTGGMECRGRSVHLRIVQTGASITKLQEFYRFGAGEYSSTGQKSDRTVFDADDWDGVEIALRAAISICESDTAEAYVYNVDDAAAISGSTVSGSNYDESSEFDPPGDGEKICPYISDAGYGIPIVLILVNVELPSSGGTPVYISGAVSATAALSGATAFTLNAGGTVSASASASAAPVVVKPVSGAVAAVSGAVAEGARVITASGLSPPVSSVSGRADIVRNVSGTSSATASASASPAITTESAGYIQSSSFAQATAELVLRGAGSVGATTSVQITTETVRDISGAVAAETGASATAELRISAAGIVAAASGGSATAEVSRGTAGQITGSSEVSGRADLVREAKGSLAGVSGVSATAEVSGEAAGQIGGVSAVSARLEVSREAKGSLSGSSGVSGRSEISSEVKGSVVGASAVSGRAEVVRGAKGSVAGAASCSAVSAKISGTCGEIAAAAGVSGRAETVRLLSGGSGAVSGISAREERIIEAKGSVSGAASVSGDTRVAAESEVLVSGEIPGVSAASATALVEKSASASVAASAALSGKPERVIPASGSIPGTSSVSGTAEVISGGPLSISGAVEARSGVSATAERTISVSGSSAALSSLTGRAVVPVEGPVIARLDSGGNLSIAGRVIPGQDCVRLLPNGDLELGSVITGEPGARIEGAVLYVLTLSEEADMDG